MRNADGRRFTLIELLVVVATIAILAALLLPVLARARTQARLTLCLNKLRQLGMITSIYADDFDDTYPRSSFNAAGVGTGSFELTYRWSFPYDDRDQYRGYLNLDELMQCPFSEFPRGMSLYDPANGEHWAGYDLWYGTEIHKGERSSGLLRVGDRAACNGSAFDILAADFLRTRSMGWHQNPHPDWSQLLVRAVVWDASYRVVLYWNQSNYTNVRMPRNFLRRDGSSFQITEFNVNNANVVRVTAQPSLTEAAAEWHQYLVTD